MKLFNPNRAATLMAMALCCLVAGCHSSTPSNRVDPRAHPGFGDPLNLVTGAGPYDSQRYVNDRLSLIERAHQDPALRAWLIDGLVDRLLAYEDPGRGNREIEVLHALRAVEALPAIERRWIEQDKRVLALEWADSRLQLLKTIASLSTNERSTAFLRGVLHDEGEAPQVRFRALVLLSTRGDTQSTAIATRWIDDRYDMHPAQLPEPAQSPPIDPTQDPDGDGLTTAYETRLRLDPNNPDTDGDGLSDGQDRNPLTRPDNPLSDEQQIARLIFLIHATFLVEDDKPRTDETYGLAPLPTNDLLVAPHMDNWSGDPVPGPFMGVELIGIDSIVLPEHPVMDPPFIPGSQIRNYDTPRLYLHAYTQEEIARSDHIHTYAAMPGDRVFHLTTMRAQGTMRIWIMVFREIDGRWLPVYWQLRGLS